MKKMALVTILIMVIINSVLATGISLTGTVTNTSGAGVANATVRLNKLPFQTLTDSNGKFSIIEDVPIIPVKKLKKSGPVLLNNTLTFHLDKSCRRVCVEIFNCQGKLFFRKETQPLFTGKYSMVLFDNTYYAQGLYLIRVTLSNKSYFLKKIITGTNYPHVSAGNNTASTSENNNTITADTENYKRAMDVLVVTATNYATKKIDLDSYQKDLTVTLDAAPQKANIEFNNIDLAFDETFITEFDRKDSLFLNILLGNSGMENALSVQCSISTDDQYIEIVKSTAGYDNIIKQGTTLNQDVYKIVVDKNTPLAHPVHFKLNMVDSWGDTWNDECYLILNPFVIENQVIDDDSIGASKGNKNGLVESDETIEYTPKFLNGADFDIKEVSALLISHNDQIEIDGSNNKWLFGDIDAGGERPPELDYVFMNGQLDDTEYITLEFFINGKVSGIEKKWIMPCKLPHKKNDPPAKPELKSPQDNQNNVNLNTTLTWECSDPNNDPLTYKVYFEKFTGSNNDPATVLATVTEKSKKPDNLDYETTYIWKIEASDGSKSSMSDIWKFSTIKENLPPEKPNNLSPPDGQIDESTSPTLSWECSDPDNDPLTYKVYFEKYDGTNNDPATVYATVSDKSVQLQNLDLGNTYIWKIEASDGVHSSSSDVCKFSTVKEYYEYFLGKWSYSNYITLPDSVVTPDINGDIHFEFWVSNDNLLYLRYGGQLFEPPFYNDSGTFSATNDILYLDGKAHPYAFREENTSFHIPSEFRPGTLELYTKRKE